MTISFAKNFVNEDLTRVWDKKTKKSILSLEIIKIGTLLYFSESYTSAELFLKNYVRRAPKSPSRLLGRPFNIPFKKNFRQEMDLNHGITTLFKEKCLLHIVRSNLLKTHENCNREV